MSGQIADASPLVTGHPAPRLCVSLPWAHVKHHWTPIVKPHLALSIVLRQRIDGMAKKKKDEGRFSPEQLAAIGKRMGQAIRMSRKNQSQVAGQIEVSRSAMNQYCSGKTSIQLHKLAAFCEVTKASMDYIVFGAPAELEASIKLVMDKVISGAKESQEKEAKP